MGNSTIKQFIEEMSYMNKSSIMTKFDTYLFNNKLFRLVMLLFSNCLVVLFAIILMILIISFSIRIIGFSTPVILGSTSELIFLLIFLSFIMMVTGVFIGYIQSLLVTRQARKDWSTVSGIFWFLSYFGEALLFIILDIFEDWLQFRIPITGIWFQLIGAALVGVMVGHRQVRYLHSRSDYERWWVFINAISYILAAGLAFFFQIVQLHHLS